MPYLTGDDPGTAIVCYQIAVPDDPNFLAAFNGALIELTESRNWEGFGDLTPDECVELAETMLESITEVTC